jgi:hypothetical protein
VPSSFALSACPNQPMFIHTSEYYKKPAKQEEEGFCYDNHNQLLSLSSRMQTGWMCNRDAHPAC